jgi:aspartyl-tRNA(Asn)/glutamyl-tRNA(Gln) amidotransferase subunit B
MNAQPKIGLEIHVQLDTRSRLFSACPRAFDTSAAPNAATDPITLGLPGTLPTINERAVELAVLFGAVLGGEINRRSEFDRKHYFYPDLPRNYQITQQRAPLVRGGRIPYEFGGGDRTLELIRCHLEEDAGRSVHRDGRTLVDFNRAGVGLLEIVTQPDLREPDEAAAVLRSLRELVRWYGVNEGSLEEGQIRCDANVSLTREGRDGARVELKNLNSVRGVARAIEAELRRQESMLAAGEQVTAETRGWNAESGRSFAQRGKEGTADYRFLPEPDLGPLLVEPDEIPDPGERPSATRARWRRAGMSAEAARILSDGRSRADWCDTLLGEGAPAGELGRWASGELLHRARDLGGDLLDLPWSAKALADLLADVESGRRTVSAARDLLDRVGVSDLGAAIGGTPAQPPEPVNEAALRDLLARHPEQVAHYRGGKTRTPSLTNDPAALAAALRRLLSRDDG